MMIERLAMWICRRCAAHLNDEVMRCPCCAMTAPGRLQPELARHVSHEVNKDPRRGQINWLTHTALPNLRKQVESPWEWAFFGFCIGIGFACGHFQELLRVSAVHERDLSQPILYGVGFGVVLGVIGGVLRWRLNRAYRVEKGAILGFLIPLILAIICTFANHPGREGEDYLLRNSIPIVGASAMFAVIAAGSTLVRLRIIHFAGSLSRLFAIKGPNDDRTTHDTIVQADSVDQQSKSRDAEPSDKIARGEDQVKNRTG